MESLISSGGVSYKYINVHFTASVMPIFILLSITYINPVIYYLTTSCYCWIEKGAFTPKAPRWKVDGRQSSSVSVLLPIGCPQKVTVKQESIPRQSFVVYVHDSKHLARPPQKGG